MGEGASTRGTIATLAAIPAGWLFLRREKRAKAPMMPLSLFRDRNFSGANALTVLLYAALGRALFLLPFMLIQLHGYSATAAGAAFLPFSAIMGLGSRWSGSLVDRVGSRPPLVIGPAVTAAGFALLGLSGSVRSGFLPGLIVVGIGMTIAVAPLTTTAFNTTPDDKSCTASGINNAAARAGSLIAAAALGLAFGGATSTEIGGSALANACQLVMFAAAGLACISALIALLTIGSREQTIG